MNGNSAAMNFASLPALRPPWSEENKRPTEGLNVGGRALHMADKLRSLMGVRLCRFQQAGRHGQSADTHSAKESAKDGRKMLFQRPPSA
jgi:hypothetical protein